MVVIARDCVCGASLWLVKEGAHDLIKHGKGGEPQGHIGRGPCVGKGCDHADYQDRNEANKNQATHWWLSSP